MPGSDDVKPAGVKLTYDDYVLFPDDGKRHELIDGEHYVTPTPFLRHQQISGNLYWLLRSYLEQHPIGHVFCAPLDVIISSFNVVEPDLLDVSKERAPALLRKWVHGAPDLVVEIASESTRRRDEMVKRSLYERSGVIEYWIVDAEIDVIRVFRRSGDRFDRPVEWARVSADALTTALLPGFELPLARVFAD